MITAAAASCVATIREPDRTKGNLALAGFEADLLLKELEAAHKRMPTVDRLLLSTGDGQVVAACPSAGVNDARLAAMTSALLALGETISNELGMSQTEYVAIHGGQHQLVLRRVDTEKPMALALATRSGANMGSILYAAHYCAKRIVKATEEKIEEADAACEASVP